MRMHPHFSSNDFFSSGGSVLSVQDLLNPIPPPGFNFEDLAAFNQDLGIKAVIDPATEWRLAVAERLLRESPGFGGSGFFLLDGGGAYAVPIESTEAAPASQQPQVIVVQAAPATAQPAAAPAPQPVPEAAAPLPDNGQFVLVLRNGTQIQAVAFTRTGDRVVYITADGFRRTLALADLDSDSTVRINQERGTPLQFTL